MSDLPRTIILHKDEGRACTLLNVLRPRVEAGRENKSRNAGIAENFNVQVIRPHAQLVGGGEPFVFAIARSCGIQSGTRAGIKFRELRAVQVIAVEANQILLFTGIHYLVQNDADFSFLPRIVRGVF